jgi:signal peptidase II
VADAAENKPPAGPSGPPERPSGLPAYLNRILVLAIVTVAVVGLDQLTKLAAFELDGERSLLGGLIVLNLNQNPGAAFGFLRNVPGSPVILSVTTLATIVLLAVLFRKLIRTHLVTGCIAIGLIYGGAIGNLVDRVAFGKVRDFIELHLGFVRWPAFNLADVGIVAGIVLLLAGLLGIPRRRHAHGSAAAASAPAEAASNASGEA